MGVASVSAIFAVFNAMLLRPLPFSAADQLYAITGTEPSGTGVANELPASALQLARYRSESRLFSGIAGYTPTTITLTGHGEPEPLKGSFVSAGFFSVL